MFYKICKFFGDFKENLGHLCGVINNNWLANVAKNLHRYLKTLFSLLLDLHLDRSRCEDLP